VTCAQVRPTGLKLLLVLVEPEQMAAPSPALMTILEEAPPVSEAALLSEAALEEDRNRAGEDAPWAHLQPGKLS
jgi:hypothetical protein